MLVLAFTLGGERCGVDVHDVHRVLPAVPPRVMKGAPPHLPGIVTYRGKALTVVDLQAWSAGEPARPALATRLIVLRPWRPGQSGPDTAVIAECVNEVVAVDEDTLALGPSDPGAPWVRGRVTTPDRPLTLVALAEWVAAASASRSPSAASRRQTGRGSGAGGFERRGGRP